jgi:hypothetical protein
VPTVVVDQLVNGVVAADDELVLEELLPPAQAIKVIGKTKMARFFKIDPYSQLWQMMLAFSYIYSVSYYSNPISRPIKRSLILESY